jgi:hypothetical protein
MRRRRNTAARLIAGLVAFTLLSAQSAPDPRNPSCPAEPDWGPGERMSLTVRDVDGKRVLIGEGVVDSTLPERLRSALDNDEMISEIWLKSRGGNATAGNEAGRVIRSIPGMLTRIPSGWTCFSACNFVFMGGDRRHVDPGGIFMVHMFTHTSDRSVINESVLDGTKATTELIADIEQSSAMLASEDNDFLIRMGISRKLLTEVMYRQQAVGRDDNPSTRYCLTQEEVRKYNVMPEERKL